MDKIVVKQWSESNLAEIVAYFKPIVKVCDDVDCADEVCVKWITKLMKNQKRIKRFLVIMNKTIIAVIRVKELKNHYEITTLWSGNIKPKDKDRIRSVLETMHRKTIAPSPKTIWWIV